MYINHGKAYQQSLKEPLKNTNHDKNLLFQRFLNKIAESFSSQLTLSLKALQDVRTSDFILGLQP